MISFEALLLEFEANISDGAWKFLKDKYKFEDDTLREVIDTMDPTGKYKEWLARWLSVDVKNPGTGVSREDAQIVTQLSEFTRLKDVLKKNGDSIDIGTYTPQALYGLIEDYKEEKSLSEENAKILAEGTTEVFQEGPIKVVTPTTFAASHILSEPSGWCTQYEHNYSHYSQQGPLFVFLLRGKPILQIHNPTRQMMARGNARIYEDFGGNVLIKPITIFPQKYAELCWNGIKQVTTFAKLVEVGDEINTERLTINNLISLFGLAVTNNKRWNSLEAALDLQQIASFRADKDSGKNASKTLAEYDSKFKTSLLDSLREKANTEYTNKHPLTSNEYITAFQLLPKNENLENGFIERLPVLMQQYRNRNETVMSLQGLNGLLKQCFTEYIPTNLENYKNRLSEAIKPIWPSYLKSSVGQLDNYDKKNLKHVDQIASILKQLSLPDWGVAGFLNSIKKSETIIKFMKLVKPNERYAPAENRIIQVDVSAAINYCSEIIKERWPELEAKILSIRNAEFYYEYIDEIIKDVWLEAEPKLVKYSIQLSGTSLLSRDLFSKLVNYTVKYKKARWKAVEAVFLAQPPDKYLAPLVAKYCVLVAAPWPAVEPVLVDDPVSYKEYQKVCLGAARNADLENTLLTKKDVKTIVEYAVDFVKGPWPEAEEIIRRGVSEEIIKYCKVRGRWPLAERVILTRSSESVAKYAAAIIAPERWREAEPKILRGGINSLFAYLETNVRERWPEAEEYIFNTSSANIAEYAAKYIEGPWPEAEEHMILTDNWIAMLNYAVNIKQTRWPEAEETIPKLDYEKFVKQYTVGGKSKQMLTPYGAAIVNYVRTFFQGQLTNWPEILTKFPYEFGRNRVQDYVSNTSMLISRVSGFTTVWHRIFTS